MSRRVLVLLVLLMALAACGQPEVGKPTAAPQLDIARVDPQQLLLHLSMLPAGLTAGDITQSLPATLPAIPAAQKVAHQPFLQEGKEAGGVSLFVYDRAAEPSYDAVASGDLHRWTVESQGRMQPVRDVGERGTITLVSREGRQWFDMLFVRCAALGYIRVPGAVTIDDVLGYARQLDERVKLQACV